MTVSGVDVGSRKRHIREGSFHADVTEQAKHRGKLHPNRNAANLPVVVGDYLDLALEEQGDGLLPRHDPQGLVARVEDECLVHEATRKIVLFAPQAVNTLGRTRSKVAMRAKALFLTAIRAAARWLMRRTPSESPARRRDFESQKRSLAEGARFELANPFRSPVFKTGALNRSATPPATILGHPRHRAPWGEG